MIIDISKYKPTQQDKFLFDTNVWIYILNPRGDRGKDRQRKYSSFYKSVKNNSIFFSSHIISEYVNRALKDDFDMKREKKGWRYFKEYRKTKDYKTTIKSIKDSIKKPLLERCQKLDDVLSKDTLIDIINFISDKDMDFNDKLFVEMAKEKKIKIVTHDKDFKEFQSDHGIDILTGNPSFWN